MTFRELFDEPMSITPFDGMGLDEAEMFLPGYDRTRRLELLDAHIERLWQALPAQSRRRLGVVAVSTGVAVSPEEHARLIGALGLIAEAEGTLEEETEFAETYLSVPWVCAAVAEAERAAAEPRKPGGKKAKVARRREQVRLAVAKHRERQKQAESEEERRAREASERRMEITGKLSAIALDGEGVSLDDGSHLYRYMAASLSDGTVLGELFDEAGISSAAALEFVAGLPKYDGEGRPFLGVFGYGLGYDITKWLERLANKPLYELFHSDDLKPKVKCGSLRLLLIGKCLEVVDVRAPKGERRTRVWDIIKGFQSTFVKALKAWGVGTPEEWQRIEDMKKQRGNFANVSWDAVTGYCKDECRLLAQLVETYIRAHVDAGIDLRGKYHGAGSTSDAFLTGMNALDKRCNRESHSKHFDAFAQTRTAFSRAFFGGRAEVSRLGVVRGPVWTADIASAYPHVLFELPCVKHGKWHHVKGRAIHRSLRAAKVGVVHYRIDLDGALDDRDYVPPEGRVVSPLGEPVLDGEKRAKAKRKKQAARAAEPADVDDEPNELQRSVHERADRTGIQGDVSSLPWGPLPYRTAKGSIVFPASHPGGWAWKPEYEAACRHANVTPIEAWVFKGACKCEPPYQAIGRYYLLRIEWGSDGRGKVLKLGYNGCYGKFAQVIGKNPKYSCRVIAGHITASTRGRLFDAIQSAKDPWNVIYAATDGLISTEPLAPPNPEPNETTAKTKKWLGVWEVEKHVEDLFLVQPGFYFSMDKAGKARTRGTPLEIIYEYREKIVEQWRKAPMGKPRGLPKQSTFHGVKSSIRPPSKASRGKYKRDPLYGRWTSENRKINYVVNPKRSALETLGDDSYRLRTWWMHMTQPESAEYKKDPSFAAKDLVNDEQPDFVEPFAQGVGAEE
jgi:hypothetical protein